MRYDQFYQCPICGCSLDPGEKCDCQKEKRRQMLMMPSVSFTEIPDNTKRTLNASLAEAVRTAFQDPKVCRDYEKWRKERARRKELIHE